MPMWDWLWLLAQAQLTALPPAPPAAAAPADTCKNPRLEYSGWSYDGEHRWFEGEWTKRRRYYSQTITDTCTGETWTDYDYRDDVLFESVPDRRVADVNRPQGGGSDVSGAPLRSSDLPAGPSVGGAGPQMTAPSPNRTKVPEPWSDRVPPFFPGLLLAAGVAAAAWEQYRRRKAAEADVEEYAGLIRKLITDPQQYPLLKPEIEKVAARIEQYRRKDTSGWVAAQLHEAFAEDQEAVKDLVLLFKRDQYRGLVERREFGNDNPGFAQDPWFEPLALLWHGLDKSGQNEVAKHQVAWKEFATYWGAYFRGDRGPNLPADPWGLNEVALQAFAQYKLDEEQFTEGRGLKPAPPAPTADAWPPSADEVAWIQVVLGVEERGYGPVTKAAVQEFQRSHGIPVDEHAYVGPKTMKALREASVNLVHEAWQDKAEGREPNVDLGRLLDAPLPDDVRRELTALDQAHKDYWAAVEGRYQAILRRDSSLVAAYDRKIESARGAGVRLEGIEPLAERYQPIIEALLHQAEKVEQSVNDGEYAKLLAMLSAADDGKWDAITGAKPAAGGRWSALLSSDKKERSQASSVVNFLTEVTATGKGREPVITVTTPESMPQLADTSEAGHTQRDTAKTAGSAPRVPVPVIEGEFDPSWPVDKKIAYWKPHAMQAQAEMGIPWQVILAQFGLESGYGRFVPTGSNNAFGVTADGETDPTKYVEADTVEGSGLGRRRKFRKYASYADSFKDHNKILLSSIYRDAMSYNDDPYQYLAMVWVGNVTSGYATDPYYVEKVAAIIFKLDTGKEATVEYRVESDTKLGLAKVTHVIPTGEFAEVLREKVYGHATLREALLNRHQQLYKQGHSTSWDYPTKVYLGGETVSVQP